jgi:hypothetical protein
MVIQRTAHPRATRTRTNAMVALLLAFASAVVTAQPEKQEAVDVTGVWLFQVETAAGSGTPTFTFKQEGEALEGEYEGVFGHAKVAGTVKGNTISFGFNTEAEGVPLTIKYDGTVAKDEMKGKVAIGDVAEGTFTAKRK